MAVVALTAQVPTEDGLDLTLVASTTEGFTFQNTGKELLYIDNSTAGAMTLVVENITLSDHGYDNDETLVVSASSEGVWGPFPKNRFDDSDGVVTITCDKGLAASAALVRGR